MPTILGANSVTGDFITNSLRISPSDDGFLIRTTSGVSDSNRKTFTFSWWAKLTVGVEQHLYGFRVNGDNMSFFRLNDDGQIRWANEDYSGTTGSPNVLRVQTNRKLRDPSAWFHLVLRADTTQGTAANRIRFYINGVQETSLANTDYPAQNFDIEINQADAFIIGAMRNTNGTTTGQVDGYLSEVHFADGQSLAPTVFGETNDNGVWIPKDCKDDITYGTRGFYMQFKETGTDADASGIGADTSGNGNHFTPTNLVANDITTDTPQNNFCTGNPLDVSGVDNPGDVCTFSEGNTKIVQAGSSNVVGWKASTIGIRNGKWYFEVKLPIIDFQVFGVGDSTWDGQDGAADNQFSVYIDNGTETFRRGAGVNAAALNVTSANNDIWMFALDLDSPKLWIGHQGTWLASGDPAAGSNPMSTQAITDTLFIGGSLYTQNDSQILINTGNPSYANSSSQADDNGYGDFEYDVPAGFYSICTKNLAEFG